jgi:TusA-related sulfurtransferase
MVVTALTLPGTDAPAGLGDTVGVPEPGDVVRLILGGQSFAEWIEQKRALGPMQVGDVVEMVTDHAQAYEANRKPKGPKITTQKALDAIPRGTSVGVYGPLTLRRATPDEAEWVAKAEAAYHAAKAPIALDDDTEAPF